MTQSAEVAAATAVLAVREVVNRWRFCRVAADLACHAAAAR